MIWSISSATELRAPASEESVAPSSSSDCARLTKSVIEPSAASVASCQPCASEMLLWYCSLAASVWRRPIARAVLYGSSLGRVISLPEEALDCVLASFSDERVEVREDVALDHRGRDAHYRPTFPVRLMRTSSISSIVDMARADAW